MSKINLDGATISGNGLGGLLIVGDEWDVSAVGVVCEGNGGEGVVLRPASLVERLGFSADLEPEELADVLELLRTFPPEEREHEINSSGIAERLGVFFVGTTTVTANLITILGFPDAAAVISALWRAGKD